VCMAPRVWPSFTLFCSSVPATQQCSLEIRQFIKLMSSYQNLVRAFYTIRSMREGLWTASMAKQLAETPNKDKTKMEWFASRHVQMRAAFEKTLKADSRENSAYIDTKTLVNREVMALQRAIDNEQTKLVNVKMTSKNGHLKDAVAMMSGALAKSMGFYGHELSWLSPRLSSAARVSQVFNETVAIVKESTKSLVLLFQQKGKELQELQRLSTDDEADRKLLQIEKEVWARKKRELEKSMQVRRRGRRERGASGGSTTSEARAPHRAQVPQAGMSPLTLASLALQKKTRMAKVASSACLLTRQENAELLTALEVGELTLLEEGRVFNEEQGRVDEIYSKLQECMEGLQHETHECNEKERYILRQKAAITIKKNELEKLQNRLTANGKYGDANTIDVEKDIKRMEGKLVAEKRAHSALEHELQTVEQKLFELELNKMEAR